MHFLEEDAALLVPVTFLISVMDMEIDSLSDWLELEKDTIELIFTKLTAVVDVIRFSAVCKTWRFIFLENRHHLLQLPVLIIPSEDYVKNKFRSFFSLSYKQTYSLKKLSHDYNNKYCCGSSDGYLIMIDTHLNMSLLNPFSEAESPLPRLTTLSHIIDVRKTETGTIEYMYQVRHKHRLWTTEYRHGEKFVHKAIIAGPYVVVIFAFRSGLAFCRRYDERWTYVKSNWSHFEDIMFYNGNFYVVTLSGCVGILDVSEACMVDMIVERDLVFRRRYLIECFGQLLMVTTRLKLHKTSSFEIFRVDLSKHQLFPLKGLGDVMLFLGENCSMSVSAKDFTGWKGNCIYFTKVEKEWYFEGQLQGHNIVVYNVEDGSIKTHYKMDSKWFWSQPTWLIPKP